MVFNFFDFRTGKIEKLDFWDSNNSTNFKYQQLENHKCKFYQLAYDKKAYWMLFRNVFCEGNVYYRRFRDIAVEE